MVDIHLRLPAKDAALVMAAVEHTSVRVREIDRAGLRKPTMFLEENVSEENVSAGTTLDEYEACRAT